MEVFKRLKTIRRGFENLSFVPTIHDIKSVKKLAERLRGADYAETLVNILEWLERNLTYWTERAYLDSIARSLIAMGLLLVMSLIFLVVFYILVFLYIFLFVLFGIPLYLPLVISLSLATSLIPLILLLAKTSPSTKLLLIVFGPLIIHYFMVKSLELQHVGELVAFLNLGVIYWIIAGGSAAIFIYLLSIYSSSTRHLKGMRRLREILRLINLTFSQELPVSYILKLRRGVCRDYAKLTASILINLFPSYKIYFILIPKHVAVSVETNNKMYVLDQRLPLMSMETWLNKWNIDRPSKILILLREDDEFVVKLVNKLSHRNISIPFNLDRDLSKLIKKTFSAIATGELIASHTLVGYAKLFDIDDKAIRESLIRKIRIALEKELISNVSLVKAINLIKQGDDLIVTIVISHNH